MVDVAWAQTQARKLAEQKISELEEQIAYLDRPLTIELSMLASELEDVAKDKLKKSPSPIDKKSKVEITDRLFNSFVVRVVRPPVEEKSYKVKQKELIPGRYFEIHGPGGNVKITRNEDVMKKAKRQGIHVQTKYQHSDGKTDYVKGIYDAHNTEKVRPLTKKQIFDPLDPEFIAAITRFGNRLTAYLETL